MALLLKGYLRETPPTGPSAPDSASGSRAGTTTAPQRSEPEPAPTLCCRACGAVVTDPQARTLVLGAHEHHFVNPGGVAFHIACFDRAPGCRASGKAFREWSWFPGFAWRVGLCAACRAHLGWRYESMNAGVFFGIIVGRLVPCTRPDDPGAHAAP